MPQITWTELVLALTVIGFKRAWQAWRSVPTYHDNHKPLPLAALPPDDHPRRSV